LKLAQKLLGHSTVDLTASIYTHTSAEQERQAAIALERAIFGDLFPDLFPTGNKTNGRHFSEVEDLPEGFCNYK
jgi:hypothetical protein